MLRIPQDSQTGLSYLQMALSVVSSTLQAKLTRTGTDKIGVILYGTVSIDFNGFS